MRCPDCNRMVSYGDPEPDGEVEVNEEGHVSGEVRLALPCGECGTELKETTLSFDGDAEPETEDHLPCPGGEGHTWDWANAGEPDISFTDRYQDKDRNGKKITNMRYAKHFYGVEVCGTVKCGTCNKEGTWNMIQEESAGAFDELT